MISSDTGIAHALKIVQDNIEAAVKESVFKQKVRLIAVSKTKPVEDILEAYNCGIRDFGENYVDELVEKSSQLPQDIRWHFIGHLQSNKCKKAIIPNLECLETIDSIKLAEKVSKACESIDKKELKVFVQILTSDEDSKAGVTPDASFEIIEFIRTNCSNLKFSGLMTIGATGDMEAFKILSSLREKVCEKFGLKSEEVELSMGMSGDYIEAIKCGATNVRVGSVIFGARQHKTQEEKKE